jgi:hypothetical protein
MSDLSCVQMRELAAELALDVLAGYERATGQAHLNECPSCRAYVSSLTQVSDRLLALVPSAEPPVGFEDRVLARMGLTPPPVRQPKRRWWPVAIAAAVAALVFGVGGWVIGAVTMANTVTSVAASPSSDEVLRFAVLRTADQHQIGQVFTYQGEASWMYMAITADPGVSPVTCELVDRDGAAVQVGMFPLHQGKGSWGEALAIDPSKVVGARLLSGDGAVLASATFTNEGTAYLNAHPR